MFTDKHECKTEKTQQKQLFTLTFTKLWPQTTRSLIKNKHLGTRKL